jgi:hypothetical protein
MTFKVGDSGKGIARDKPASLFFAIAVEPGYHPTGFTYGFQCVRLRLTFNEESGVRVQDRLASGKPVAIGTAVMYAHGDEYHPAWLLKTEAAMLQGEFATEDAPLCNLIGFNFDEQFEAEVSARLLDGTLVGQGGIELGNVNKRRVLAILSAKKLPGVADSQGWLRLGVQALRISREDRA